MAACEIIIPIEEGPAPYFVFADHASNAIPDDLRSLGVSEDVLQTHIAWDIGSADLAAALARALNGTGALCGFSRLVADANRAPDRDDLIPPVSDQIVIPGNQMLSREARQDRVARFYDPYHEALSARFAHKKQTAGAPFVVSIHSFTPRLMGVAEERPWQIGLLWREDELSARTAITHLEKTTGWDIGDNQPYDARIYNYSIDHHVSPRKLRHLTFEVRQDLLADSRSIREVASILAGAVNMASERGPS